jgi:protein phosphatase
MSTDAAEGWIELPPAALVVLIGAAGSGKSAFAARHLPPHSVISSDALRAELGRGERDQAVNDAVFDRLRSAIDERLRAAQLVVVDATNTDWMRRSELIRLARQHGRPAVAVVFDLPLDVCLARNRARARGVRPGVIRRQVEEVERDRDRLDLEGFTAVCVLRSTDQVDRLRVGIDGGPVSRASM